jgi:SAM-dependent methyltransferase
MHNKPIHAPVEPSKVKVAVEVACGTGAMTILLAQHFPNAHVYGIDISPFPSMAIEQATAASVADRLTWIQGNIFNLVNNHPALQPNSVDYLYHRMIRAARISYYDYLYDVVNVLVRPGGWVEMHDQQDPVRYTVKDNRPITGDIWPWLSQIHPGIDPPRYSDKPYLRYAEMPTQLQLLDYTDVGSKWYKTPLAPVEGRPETNAWADYGVRTFPGMFTLALSYAFPKEDD